MVLSEVPSVSAVTFTGNAAAAGDARGDELDAVGTHLRALMSDVADTRSILQESRNRMLQAWQPSRGWESALVRRITS